MYINDIDFLINKATCFEVTVDCETAVNFYNWNIWPLKQIKYNFEG